MREVPKSHSNGYKYIKEKLVKSKTRINSVKFGVPFTQVCHDDSREHVYDRVEQPPEASCTCTINKVNWAHLHIDPDRELFNKGLFNRFEASQKGIESLIKRLYYQTTTSCEISNISPKETKSVSICINLD